MAPNYLAAIFSWLGIFRFGGKDHPRNVKNGNRELTSRVGKREERGVKRKEEKRKRKRRGGRETETKREKETVNRE